MTCTHQDTIKLDRPAEADKEGAVCAECVKIGSDWVHLRFCRLCGNIGCCDDSPNRHARAHFNDADHPIMSSMEPQEKWTYCFVDDELVE